jgi:hypothetical protein
LIPMLDTTGEKPVCLNGELLAILDFKFRHNIPLTSDEYSAVVGEDEATSARKRVSGIDSAPFVRIGRKVRYVPHVVLKWLLDRPQHYSTSDPSSACNAERPWKGGRSRKP